MKQNDLVLLKSNLSKYCSNTDFGYDKFLEEIEGTVQTFSHYSQGQKKRICLKCNNDWIIRPNMIKKKITRKKYPEYFL